MSTLDELQAALRAVEEHLEQAQGQLVRGRKSLAEAESALAKLDPEHPETVVPSGLHRADDQIERTLTRIDHVVATLRAYLSSL